VERPLGGITVRRGFPGHRERDAGAERRKRHAGMAQGDESQFVAYKGNSTVMKAVNAGQIDGGVIYHYYRFVDQSKTGENSKNTQLYYFKHQDPGAFVSLSGGGVLASSKHKAQAQAFIKYITGKEGRKACVPTTPLNMPWA
jgi:iron(III) transport system substrate-binding protein